MERQTARGWATPTATPSIEHGSVLFTAGSSIRIKAPAKVVFNTIIGFSNYVEWNSWTPSLIFNESDDNVKPGSRGTLETRTEGQKDAWNIPIEILQLVRNQNEYKLAWQSKLLPWWAATIERVQVVTPNNEGTCEVTNWESMSGLAAYVFKFGTNVPKQLEEANVKYLDELKLCVEKKCVE